MKSKLILLAISSSLVLAAPALLAQDTNTNGTNSLPLNQTVKYQKAFENDRSLGERSLLPPGLKEKLKLTDEQRTELKPIEDDFAKTCQEYQTATNPGLTPPRRRTGRRAQRRTRRKFRRRANSCNRSGLVSGHTGRPPSFISGLC